MILVPDFDFSSTFLNEALSKLTFGAESFDRFIIMLPFEEKNER
jgi:hypothetical protein